MPPKKPGVNKQGAEARNLRKKAFRLGQALSTSIPVTKLGQLTGNKQLTDKLKILLADPCNDDKAIQFDDELQKLTEDGAHDILKVPAIRREFMVMCNAIAEKFTETNDISAAFKTVAKESLDEMEKSGMTKAWNKIFTDSLKLRAEDAVKKKKAPPFSENEIEAIPGNEGDTAMEIVADDDAAGPEETATDGGSQETATGDSLQEAASAGGPQAASGGKSHENGWIKLNNGKWYKVAMTRREEMEWVIVLCVLGGIQYFAITPADSQPVNLKNVGSLPATKGEPPKSPKEFKISRIFVHLVRRQKSDSTFYNPVRIIQGSNLATEEMCYVAASKLPVKFYINEKINPALAEAGIDMVLDTGKPNRKSPKTSTEPVRRSPRLIERGTMDELNNANDLLKKQLEESREEKELLKKQLDESREENAMLKKKMLEDKSSFEKRLADLEARIGA